MGNTQTKSSVAVAMEPPLPLLPPPPLVKSNDFVILIRDNLEDQIVDNEKESGLSVEVCYGLKKGKVLTKDVTTKQVYLFGNKSLKSDFFAEELIEDYQKNNFLSEHFECNLKIILVLKNPISNPEKKELFIIGDTVKCNPHTKGLGRKMLCKTLKDFNKYKGDEGFKNIFPSTPFDNKDSILLKYNNFCFNLQFLKDETQVKLTAVSEYGRTLIKEGERERILRILTTGKPGEKEFDNLDKLRQSEQEKLERYYTRFYGLVKESDMKLCVPEDITSGYCTEMSGEVRQIISKCDEKGGKRKRTHRKKSRR